MLCLWIVHREEWLTAAMRAKTPAHTVRGSTVGSRQELMARFIGTAFGKNLGLCVIWTGGTRNMYRFVKAIAVCSIPLALSLFAQETKPPADSTSYSHGTILCLQGTDGPGLRLVLTPTKTCEGRRSYPRMEIDIKEQAVSVQKIIVIGPDNLAFRCSSANESCEQFTSGKLVFEHFENRYTKGGMADGYYELRFRRRTERGHFKVDCAGICG
jgi:hypothetical protein